MPAAATIFSWRWEVGVNEVRGGSKRNDFLTGVCCVLWFVRGVLCVLCVVCYVLCAVCCVVCCVLCGVCCVLCVA